MDKFNQFITDSKDKKSYCDFVRLAVKRHKKLAKKYYFDQEHAANVIEFVESMEFPKVQKWELAPFQAFIIGSLFGLKTHKGGPRLFTESYIEMARKNAKSTIANACAIVDFLSEPGAEVYVAATASHQASYVWKLGKQIVQKTPWMEVATFAHSMTYKDSVSKYVSAESATLDSLNPSWNIIDEYHEHRTTALKEVLKSGSVARKQPHQMVITTAGTDKDKPCYQLRTTAVDILKEIKEDDRLFTIIFTLDEKDDWKDESKWIKANPLLGKSVFIENLQTEKEKALNEGGEKEVYFKIKNLNLWVDAPTVWIQDEVWQENFYKELTEDDFVGREVYGGLDLASGIDWNAFVILADNWERTVKNKEGEELCTFDVLPFFWIPSDKVKTIKDIPIRDWIQKGYVQEIDGYAIEHKFVVKKIIDIATKCNLQGVAYDRFLALHGVVQDVSHEGVQVHPMGQGFLSMSPPSKLFEELALARRINHGNNPVLRWMLRNVQLDKDAHDNMKPTKKKSTGKIDGVVAMIESLEEYRVLKSQNQQSWEVGTVNLRPQIGLQGG